MQMNRFYTVGIVEDEVIERQALRMIMEEKRPVLQVVFEAEDGNSALKMARQYQPDILIVDIQIPGCTGLELCQELRQEGYSGLIIISTSYSLFRYAYLAIKLNVLDYLLKPTGETQILSVLDRCILILEKNEQRKEKEQRLEEHMIRTRYEADRRLLQQMMDGNEQVFPRLKEMGFPENGQWQACWIVQAWSMAEKMDTKEVVEIYSSICQIFKQEFFVFVKLDADKILLFVQPKEKRDKFLLYTMLRCAIWSLKQLTGQKQFCYVSPISNSLEQMKTSGSQIPENLSLLPMISRDFICYTQMEQRPRAFSRDRYIFHMQKMIRFLKDNRIRYLENMFFSELQDYAQSEPQKFWEYLHIFFDAVVTVSDSRDLSFVMEKISSEGFIEDSKQQQEMIHQILIDCRTDEEESTDTSMDQILKIMREEYTSDLSQAEIAQRMGMTQTYFSRMFKNKTGKNFVSLLTEFRMNHAKELIAKEHDITISELAEKCGYTSKTYFCALFRKTVGLTVNEYRRRLENER